MPVKRQWYVLGRSRTQSVTIWHAAHSAAQLRHWREPNTAKLPPFTSSSFILVRHFFLLLNVNFTWEYVYNYFLHIMYISSLTRQASSMFSMKWDECSNNSSLNKLFQIYWLRKGNVSRSEQYNDCPWVPYNWKNNVFTKMIQQILNIMKITNIRTETKMAQLSLFIIAYVYLHKKQRMRETIL